MPATAGHTDSQTLNYHIYINRRTVASHKRRRRLVGTYFLHLLPWKKLAHSKQVFLLPTQNTEGIPTISIITYLIKKRTRSGRLLFSTCVTHTHTKCGYYSVRGLILIMPLTPQRVCSFTWSVCFHITTDSFAGGINTLHIFCEVAVCVSSVLTYNTNHRAESLLRSHMYTQM